MSPQSWVLHVDLDQFIAAVEVLRRPELAGLPVIVGGRGDPTERAVVSTASYEARAFGVGSGMPLRLAARKVPDAVILPVDAPAYTEASEQVMDALRGLGVVVEVLGWDEAFLGVQSDDPEAFARRAQSAILEATQLHSSVGIGDNKVRAKIATGFGKPRGVFRLTRDNWFEVMGPRPDHRPVGRRVQGLQTPCRTRDRRRCSSWRTRRSRCSSGSSARAWESGTPSSAAGSGRPSSTTRRGSRVGTAARRPTRATSRRPSRSRPRCESLPRRPSTTRCGRGGRSSA